MQNILKNWKTSSAGIISIAAGITVIVSDNTKITEGLTTILAGVGLLFAADSNSTQNETKV